MLPTLFEEMDSDEGLYEFCEECGELYGDHQLDDDELICP